MTRFRGMISTQPGSTPLTSFKILSLDDIDGHGGCSAGTEIGTAANDAVSGPDFFLSSVPRRLQLGLCGFRSVWGARRPAGVHPEGGSRYRQALRQAVVQREEVRDKKTL